MIISIEIFVFYGPVQVLEIFFEIDKAIKID